MDESFDDSEEEDEQKTSKNDEERRRRLETLLETPPGLNIFKPGDEEQEHFGLRSFNLGEFMCCLSVDWLKPGIRRHYTSIYTVIPRKKYD